MVVENPRRFSMKELEEGSLYMLRHWHGRPPEFIKYNDNGGFMSLASLFKGLQHAMLHYLSEESWPEYVEVPDFVRPPLGNESALPHDTRVGQAITLDCIIAAVEQLPQDDAVPYVVSIPLLGTNEPDLQANAAEFLNGMSTLFLRLRQNNTLDKMHIIPGHIIPISNIPFEVGREPDQPAYRSNLDWYNELQLWTLEPLRLQSVPVRQ